MKLHLFLVFAPLLVQCGTSSASHGSSSDSGADASDAGEDVTSSSSGGGTDGGSSGADGSNGSSGSGSGGGDGAVQTACKTAATPEHLSYTVASPGASDLITLTFDVDASWAPKAPMPAPWWEVLAYGGTCEFTPIAQLRLGAAIAGDGGTGTDGGTSTDGGISLPTTAMTWTIAGHEYPQSAADGAIALVEHTSQGVGNYWLSKTGTITGMPVGAGCYELDFAGVTFGPDPLLKNPNINMASGSFGATGMARVGTGCP